MKRYKAHWGTLLILLSSFLTVVCVGSAFVELKQGGTGVWVGLWLMALVVGCALSTIRGYTITPDAILVQRLFWTTQLPLAGLQSARFEPFSLRGNIRIGNGGFFSFTGWNYKRGLGFVRVFLTDHRRVVLLRYAKRIVAISPAAPEEFVHDLATSKHAV